MSNQDIAFCENSTLIAAELTAADDLSELCIEVVNRPEQVAGQWEILESSAPDPFSSYGWVKAWYDAHKNTEKGLPVIIVGSDKDHRPLFILPLFRRKIGPFNILLRPGRTHSAYFSGLFSPRCRQMVNSDNAGQFWKMVFSTVPWVDVIAIDGVRDSEIGHNNPLRFLPRINSSNPSYQMKLGHDWDTLYQSKMSRKARANIRRCEKRLLEQGELHFKKGESKEECLALLRGLLKQKAEQFAAREIIDPYEMENISSFYEKLVQSENGAGVPSVEIRALFLDDKPLAINLGMIQKDEFHGLIMSMVEGPLMRFSPGRILLLRTMRQLSEKGIGIFDFGAGQADYKDGWIDKSINRYHVIMPLSIKGRLFGFGLRRASALKALIKRSAWACELTKRARWNSKKD